MVSMVYPLPTVSQSNIVRGGRPAVHRYQFSPISGSFTQDPGRVLPGKKMAGHMGAKNVTTSNLQVIKVDPNLGLVLVKGAVPGPSKSVVYVRDALGKSAS